MAVILNTSKVLKLLYGQYHDYLMSHSKDV